MPKYLPFALAAACAAFAACPVAAQSAAPRTGRLHYDFTQRVDQQNVKVRMFGADGMEIKTDAPGSGVELPMSLSGRKDLLYSGELGREDAARDVQPVGGNIVMAPPTGGPQRTFRRPSAAIDTRYLNLAARTVATVTAIGASSYLLAAQPLPAVLPGWKDLSQTRKIAGLLCHKATVPFHNETYTLWVTTELPFTYSPVPELTPAKGVVLALSSDREEFTATKLTAEAVAEADVRPGAQAKAVTEAELKELKDKARADERQRMMEQFSNQAPAR